MDSCFAATCPNIHPEEALFIMRESVFEVLRSEGLNHMEIHYDWKKDVFVLYAAREWDADTPFREYNRSFTVFSLRTPEARYCGHAETEALFGKYGLSGHLEKIKTLMRKGRHILLDSYYNEKLGIRFTNHIHSDKRGLNNLRSSLLMGGIRRHEPEEDEIDVFIDGMNLGRGMTFKNIAADIPMGGCKITVQMEPVDLDNLDQVGFLAYANDRTRNTSGPDMRFPPALADVMKEHFSLHIAGGAKGPLGPTGTPTAHGVHIAAKQGARFLWGSDSLEGKTVAVQGLGAVGFHLAEDYIRDGAKLVVCDLDPAAVRLLKEKNPGASIDVVEPTAILDVDADIFSPCAVGGILDETNIPGLKFRMVMGPANNVLKASSQEEEYVLADLLAARGILYQVEWRHNIAGIMTVYEEYVHQRNASMERLMEKVSALCTEKTWENLNGATREGITPTKRAYMAAEREVYGE